MESHPFIFDERLDTEFLLELYEDEAEHAITVFSEFLHLAPSLMNEIDASYQTGKVDEFRQKVHKLKPVFSFVGLTQLTASAENLEKKCTEIFQISDVRKLYEEFKYHFDINFPIIENETKRLQSQIN